MHKDTLKKLKKAKHQTGLPITTLVRLCVYLYLSEVVASITKK